MILDPILPEIYTFIDFTKHGCATARKNGERVYNAHLAGEIPKEHPMPYNVYVPVREFLYSEPKAVEAIIAYLESEFKKPSYDYTKINISSSKCSIKKSFGRTKEFPQIDVQLEW